LSDRTVETNVGKLTAKLVRRPRTREHRRILAVLAYLNVYGDRMRRTSDSKTHG
jgi:hypothetical protein